MRKIKYSVVEGFIHAVLFELMSEFWLSTYFQTINSIFCFALIVAYVYISIGVHAVITVKYKFVEEYAGYACVSLLACVFFDILFGASHILFHPLRLFHISDEVNGANGLMIITTCLVWAVFAIIIRITIYLYVLSIRRKHINCIQRHNNSSSTNNASIVKYAVIEGIIQTIIIGGMIFLLSFMIDDVNGDNNMLIYKIVFIIACVLGHIGILFIIQNCSYYLKYVCISLLSTSICLFIFSLVCYILSNYYSSVVLNEFNNYNFVIVLYVYFLFMKVFFISRGIIYAILCWNGKWNAGN